MEDERSTREGTGTAVGLRVVRSVTIDIASALEALRDPGWLGTPVMEDDPPPERRRILTDLELPILDGSSSGPIRKAAYLEIGLPRRHGDEVRADLAWRSSSFAPLFPVFEGEVRASPRQVSIDGAYLPPFGRLGLVMDRRILHLVARRTALALLARLVAGFAAQTTEVPRTAVGEPGPSGA